MGMSPERFTLYFMSVLIALVIVRVAWLYFDSSDPPEQRAMLHPSSKRELDAQVSVSSGKRPAFVLCYAEWCPNCAVAREEFSKLLACALESPSPLLATFSMVDIDKVPEIVQEYDIASIPMVLMFEGRGNMRKLSQDSGSGGFPAEIRSAIGDRSFNC